MRLLIADGTMCSCSAARAMLRRSQTATNRRSVVRSRSRMPRIDRRCDVPIRNVGRSEIPLAGLSGMSRVSPTPAPTGGTEPETTAPMPTPSRRVVIREVGLRDGLQSIAHHPADRAQEANGSAPRTRPASARSRSARSCRRACCRSWPTPPSWSRFAKTLPGLVRLGAGAQPERRRARHRRRRRPDARAAVGQPRAQPRQPAQDARRGGRRGRRASAPRATPPARRR